MGCQKVLFTSCSRLVHALAGPFFTLARTTCNTFCTSHPVHVPFSHLLVHSSHLSSTRLQYFLTSHAVHASFSHLLVHSSHCPVRGCHNFSHPVPYTRCSHLCCFNKTYQSLVTQTHHRNPTQSHDALKRRISPEFCIPIPATQEAPFSLLKP